MLNIISSYMKNWKFMLKLYMVYLYRVRFKPYLLTFARRVNSFTDKIKSSATYKLFLLVGSSLSSALEYVMPKHVDKIFKTYNHVKETERQALISGDSRLMPWGLNEAYFLFFMFIILGCYILSFFLALLFFDEFVFSGYISYIYNYIDPIIWTQDPCQFDSNNVMFDALLSIEYVVITKLYLISYPTIFDYHTNIDSLNFAIFCKFPEIIIFFSTFYFLLKSLNLIELVSHPTEYLRFIFKMWRRFDFLLYFQFFFAIIQMYVSYLYTFLHNIWYPSCSDFIEGFCTIHKDLSKSESGLTFWFYSPTMTRVSLTNKYQFFLFDNLLVHDVFYVWLKFLFLFLFFVFIKLLQITSNKLNIISAEQPFLIIALLFFGLVALMSLELNILYLCFEAITIIVAILIALQYSEFAIDAAIKYFSLSAVASGLLIFAASVFYGNLLVTDLLGVSDFFFSYAQSYTGCNITPLHFGFSLLITSFFIKLAVWPGNLWVLDIYGGCSITLLFLISVVLKVLIFSVFIRVLLFGFFYLYFYWKILLLVSALGSLIFSAVGLSFENNLNCFIAYSSVGQFGFMLIGLACYPSIQALNSVLFYLFFYSIIMCGFFLMLPIVFGREISNNSISSFYELYKHSPFLAVVATIFLSSLAGLPPFLGFFAKYNIFVVMLSSNLSFGLICLILVATVLTSYGYFRIIKFIWFTKEQAVGDAGFGGYYTLPGCLNYDASKLSLFPGFLSPEYLFVIGKLKWYERDVTLLQKYLIIFREFSFALPIFLFVVFLQTFGYSSCCFILVITEYIAYHFF